MQGNLDDQQRRSADQFNERSGAYGRSHILADTADVARLLDCIPRPHPAGSEPALDVGAGGGHCALALARHGFAVTIGDIAASMLEKADALLREEGFAAVEARKFPAEALPFPDQSFALVSSRVAAHHFSSSRKFVREAARVLRPGGYFLLIDGSVPEGDSAAADWINRIEKWRDLSHGRLLARAEWEALALDGGLDVVVSELRPLEQPDLEWYFETAATSPENRARVIRAIEGAPDSIRRAMNLRTAPDGRITWTWQRIELLARKPPPVAAP